MARHAIDDELADSRRWWNALFDAMQEEAPRHPELTEDQLSAYICDKNFRRQYHEQHRTLG